MPSLTPVALLLLATSLALSIAAPTNELHDRSDPCERSALGTRDDGGLLCLYLNNGENWSGEGENLCEVAGRCSPALPDGLTANVSSAGPDEGVACFLYDAGNCGGNRSEPIVNPGYGDLGDIGFDKKAESWRCWRLCGEDASGSSSTSSTTSTSSLEPSIASSAGTKGVVITTTRTFGAGTTSSMETEMSISTTVSKVPTRRGAAAAVMEITTTLSGPQPTATGGGSSSSSGVSSSSTLSPTPSSESTASATGTLGPLPSGPIPFDSITAFPSSSSTPTLGPLSNPPIPFDSLTSSSTASTLAMTAPTPDVGSSNSTTSSSSSTLAVVSITSTLPAIPTPTNLGMFTSVMTMTHTFADGSTTLVTTALVEPIVATATEGS